MIGGEDPDSIDQIVGIYKNWIEPSKIITTNLWSSELSKLVANAFLAQRVSSINTISALCEATGANIQEVAKAIGTDRRIGESFLNAGPGFGGSCFKKDILNLIYLCRFYSLNEVADYWEQIIKINLWQQKRITAIIIQKLFGTLTNKKLVILGFSYKANTNDTRESPSASISRDLLNEGAKLAIYDPKVTDKNIFKEFDGYNHNGEYIVCNSALIASEDADAILVLTEWDEFKDLEWYDIYAKMRKPAWIFDARVCLDRNYLKNIGFNIWTLGNE